MAEGILVLKTWPGRARPGAQTLAIGSYEALFVYQLDPAIEDFDHLQVAPTPPGTLVTLIGQPIIDRYLSETELSAFSSGAGAWEYVTGERATFREVEDGPLRVETLSEMVERLRTQWAAAKARAVAEWTATYQYTGRRLAP